MRILWLALVVLGGAATGIAGEFGCAKCVSCGGHCVLRVQPGATTETCFDVECTEVCIPAVRFPWDCGPARPGRARLVTRLTSEERERPACDYEWVNICQRCGQAQQDAKPAVIPDAPPPAPKPPAGKSGRATKETASEFRAIWPRDFPR